MSDSSYRAPASFLYEPHENRVRLELETAEEAQRWLAKAGAGDFVVRLDVRLEEGSEVEVVLYAGVFEFPLRCRVKQVFRSGVDRHGTMVEWLDKDGAEEQSLAARVGETDSPVTEMGSAPFEVTELEVGNRDPALEEPSAGDSEVAEPLASEGEAESERAPASDSFTLTRRLPDPEPESADLFDASLLHPDSDDAIPLVAAVPDPGSGDISVEAAERGADALEALINESGEWRRKTDERRLADLEEADDQPAKVSDDPTLTPEAQQAKVFNETQGVSLAHNIGQMNPNQKARLAVRASRQERRLLLRDSTFAVQMGLLNNPRTEIKEILEIAKHPQTTGGILKRLGSDRKWTGNYEIQLALVKHPGTPSPMAIRLLDQARLSDLRVLAKSQALRENVRKAALRLYLQRSP